MARYEVDITQVDALAGFLSTLSEQIAWPNNINQAVKLAHSEMSLEFNEYMDTISVADPSAFHHVYEWGMLGSPSGRLWKNKLIGRGRNRVATFEWLPSKKVVPVVPEAAALGVQEEHHFTWKAPVMEFSTDITIKPKAGSKGLAFFTGPVSEEGRWKIRFLPAPTPLIVHNPGGQAAKGSFTTAYSDWWGGAGGQEAMSNVARTLEAPFEGLKRKVFSISVLTPSAGRNAGAMAAEKFLEERNRAYAAAAIKRGANND